MSEEEAQPTQTKYPEPKKKNNFKPELNRTLISNSVMSAGMVLALNFFAIIHLLLRILSVSLSWVIILIIAIGVSSFILQAYFLSDKKSRYEFEYIPAQKQLDEKERANNNISVILLFFSLPIFWIILLINT